MIKNVAYKQQSYAHLEESPIEQSGTFFQVKMPTIVLPMNVSDFTNLAPLLLDKWCFIRCFIHRTCDHSIFSEFARGKVGRCEQGDIPWVM